MDYKEFFKPTVWTWIFFIIFIIAAYYILANLNLKIIPCEIQPVVPNPPAPKSALCHFAPTFLPLIYLSGVRTFIKPSGYFIGIITLAITILIAYILACAVNYYITSRTTSKNPVD